MPNPIFDVNSLKESLSDQGATFSEVDDYDCLLVYSIKTQEDLKLNTYMV